MKPFTTIAAIIFGLMAVLHAYRLAVGIPIMIHEQMVAQWVSWIGVIVAGTLSVGLFREAKR